MPSRRKGRSRPWSGKRWICGGLAAVLAPNCSTMYVHCQEKCYCRFHPNDSFSGQIYHDGTSVFRSYLFRRVKTLKVEIFALGNVVPSAWDATLRGTLREQRHVFRDVDCSGLSPKHKGPLLSPILENAVHKVLASKQSYFDKFNIKMVSVEVAALMLTLVSKTAFCYLLPSMLILTARLFKAGRVLRPGRVERSRQLRKVSKVPKELQEIPRGPQKFGPPDRCASRQKSIWRQRKWRRRRGSIRL